MMLMAVLVLMVVVKIMMVVMMIMVLEVVFLMLMVMIVMVIMIMVMMICFPYLTNVVQLLCLLSGWLHLNCSSIGTRFNGAETNCRIAHNSC